MTEEYVPAINTKKGGCDFITHPTLSINHHHIAIVPESLTFNAHYKKGTVNGEFKLYITISNLKWLGSLPEVFNLLIGDGKEIGVLARVSIASFVYCEFNANPDQTLNIGYEGVLFKPYTEEKANENN